MLKNLKIIKFGMEYLEDVFAIQKKAYKALFDKYEDADTSPYCESKEVVLEKYMRAGTDGYVFLKDNVPVGCVRVKSEYDTRVISGLAVLPECQNIGIAQNALSAIEKRYPETKKWSLITIKQEIKNCRLYEKLGYKRVGEEHVINDKLTLVVYEKNI